MSNASEYVAQLKNHIQQLRATLTCITSRSSYVIEALKKATHVLFDTMLYEHLQSSYEGPFPVLTNISSCNSKNDRTPYLLTALRQLTCREPPENRLSLAERHVASCCRIVNYVQTHY